MASEFNTSNRVKDLWFSDGSLVVRAETSMFRVSGAVLAARSTVFEDMLSFPQPGLGVSDVERFEGVPIVELHDSAVEVEPFLRAIFDSSFFMPPPSSPRLSDVLAVARLSNKYDVQYLFRRALDHLSNSYSIELSVFLNNLNKFSPGFSGLKTTPELHLRVLCLLHEVNALWLLPSAYARAAKCLPEKLFVAPSWATLPDLIKTKLHTMHAHQTRHIVALVHAVGTEWDTVPQAQACQTPQTCSIEILSVISALLEQVGNVDTEFNFFDVKDIFVP
ncbi:BTB domain-containing protein, partial [Favolaschia claudopus]